MIDKAYYNWYYLTADGSILIIEVGRNTFDVYRNDKLIQKGVESTRKNIVNIVTGEEF